MPGKENRSRSRIPSLDGLRAASIALVLFGHLTGTRNFPVTDVSTLIASVAHLGVRVFFVISGYLITGLLIREHERTGRISLAQFYIRRVFRIFPAYFAALALCAIAMRLGWITMPGKDLVHALTYTSNYDPDKVWYIGHTWSLSVEEQFYLLWPLMILILGVAGGARAAVGFVIVSPILRIALWHSFPGIHDNFGQRFEIVGDALATGCALAYLRGPLWKLSAYRRFLSSRWIACVPLLVAATLILGAHPRLDYAVGYTIANVGIAVIIDWCVRNPAGYIGRVLNARLVAYIGVLSYSIYIWQQPFLNRGSASLLASFPINIIAAAAAALLSFYLIEQPMLRARRRFTRALGSIETALAAAAPDETVAVESA